MEKINNILDSYINNLGELTMPVITTRDLFLSCGMNINFDVGREMSLLALEESIQNQNLIVLVSQKDSFVESPKEEDLYSIGTLAKITNLSRLPYNAIKISVKILNRFKIEEYVQSSPFMIARGNVISYKKSDFTSREIALSNSLKEKFSEYSSFIGRSEIDVKYLLNEVSDPDEVIDLIQQGIKMPFNTFQSILSSLDLEERFTKTYQALDNNIQTLQLERKIENKVKSKLEKMQKDVYIREKILALQEEIGQVDTSSVVMEYFDKLDALNIEDKYKEKIKKEVNRLKTLPSGTSETGVIQTYIETILDLPWKKERQKNINLKTAKVKLDEYHYGLEEVKDRIMEHLAVLKLTKSLNGPIICLVGPPGVGKTSIAKSIAAATKREFVRLSVGGTSDEAEIKGHRRTYIAAMPGRIISGIKQVKTNSPLFLLDEIDKISANYKGDPAAALLEVLDPEQNKNFSDNYLEIPFDLSNVLFVATANTTQTIPRPLLDRMEIISIPGYLPKEKLEIAKKYLVEKQLEKHGLKKDAITFSDEVLKEMIEEYTLESGVRQLDRAIAKICRKWAKKLVMEENENPDLSKENIKDFLGKEILTFKKAKNKKYLGKITGLAYTKYGGDTLTIETVITYGKGNIQLTGSLGDVMIESAKAALTYTKTICKDINMPKNFFDSHDIHIHVPEGATPKDGPSAGIAIASGIISAITSTPVCDSIAMTGEITLSGDVLPIGGLREKLLAAYRAKIKKVIIPKENEKDLADVADDIKNSLEIICVTHIDEVRKEIFCEESK